MLSERFLTTQELSEYTGLREATIQKRVERGEIDCVLKGNTYLFDRNDFPPARRSARFRVRMVNTESSVPGQPRARDEGFGGAGG